MKTVPLTKTSGILVGRFEMPCDEDLADSSRHSSFHCSTCGSASGSKTGSVVDNSHHPGRRQEAPIGARDMDVGARDTDVI